MTDIRPELLLWSSLCCDRLVAYFWATNDCILKNSSADSQWRFVARELASSCHTTSESALLLVRFGRPWDAEVLVRSVSEGTIKLLYLGEGDEIARSRKVDEYWTHIPEITRLKRHERLSAFLEKVEDRNAPEWRSFRELLLTPAEVAEVRQKYPRAQRKQMEHQWSFNEILRTLAQVERPLLDYQNIAALTYGYGTSSHLIHQDGDAIGLIWDRRNRDDERRVAVEVAHSAREIGDLITMARLRALLVHRRLAVPMEKLKKMYAEDEPLLSMTHKAAADWAQIEYPDAELAAENAAEVQ